MKNWNSKNALDFSFAHNVIWGNHFLSSICYIWDFTIALYLDFYILMKSNLIILTFFLLIAHVSWCLLDEIKDSKQQLYAFVANLYLVYTDRLIWYLIVYPLLISCFFQLFNLFWLVLMFCCFLPIHGWESSNLTTQKWLEIEILWSKKNNLTTFFFKKKNKLDIQNPTTRHTEWLLVDAVVVNLILQF